MMVGGVSISPKTPISPKSRVSITPNCAQSPCQFRSRSPPPPIFNPTVSRVSPIHSCSSLKLRVLCNSSSSPNGPGENESKTVLDAFFLGKAVAEALTERIESTVGELLSTVGRLQAEQQKQIQEFQEEVFERAKKTKEKAAKEAMEEQDLTKTWAVPNASTTTNGSVPTPSSSTGTVTIISDPAAAAIIDGPVTNEDEETTDNDPIPGAISDE